MDRQRARRLTQLTDEASQLLDESARLVADRASQRASGVYRSQIGRILGNMAAGLLFPVWREHPELEPGEMRMPGGYDPREYQLPEGAADEALAALRRADSLMQGVAELIKGLPDAAERDQSSRELATVSETIRNAVRDVQRRRGSVGGRRTRG